MHQRVAARALEGGDRAAEHDEYPVALDHLLDRAVDGADRVLQHRRAGMLKEAVAGYEFPTGKEQ